MAKRTFVIDTDMVDFEAAYNNAITLLGQAKGMNSEPNPSNLAEAVIVMQKSRQAVIGIAEILLKELKVFKKMVK